MANRDYPFFSTGGTHLLSDSGLNAFSEGLLSLGGKNRRFSDIAVWGSSRRSTSGGGEGVAFKPESLRSGFPQLKKNG